MRFRNALILSLLVCTAFTPAIAQESLTGTLSGSVPTDCPNSSGQNPFSGSLFVIVEPSLDSLAASGGSFSGTVIGSGTSQDCGKTKGFSISGSLSGTVSAGGAVTFTLSASGTGGAEITGSGGGTPAALNGKLSVSDDLGDFGSGTFTLAPAPGSALTGAFSAGGAVYCNPGNTGDNSTGQLAVGTLLVATTQPSLTSLSNGGQFTGSLSGSGASASSCGTSLDVSLTGSIAGSVSAGGAVTWTFTINALDSKAGSLTLSGGGSGTTSVLTAEGTITDPTQYPSPLPYQIALTTLSSQSGGTPPVQIPGGGGGAQVSLPGGTVGVAYSQNLPAAGGTVPYDWSLVGGNLPAGLTLSQSGVLSGTPAQAGGALFTATVYDITGASASSVFAIVIAPPSVAISTASLPNGIVGSPYPAQTLAASGGTPPYTFQATGLPAGVTLSNGAITGKPTASGTFTVTLSVADSASPAQTGSTQLQFVVSPARTDLILSQTSVTFTLPNGASELPPAARITVQSNTATQPLNYTVTVTPAASWLSVQSGGVTPTTPGALNISLTQQAFQVSASTKTSVVVTCAQPSPCAGNAQTITISLNVTNAPPQLSVTTPSLSFFASSSNPQPVSQPLGLANTGGGQIFINSLTASNDFVTITGNPVSLEGGPPSLLTVTVDPTKLVAGFYQGAISVATSVGTVSVPLTVVVTSNATMTLNPAGSIFNALAGSLPGNATGSFQVSVAGSGTVNWTATLLPGANWLTLNTASGSSTAATPGTVSFTINSNATGLAAQPYYGAIQVSSGSVLNTPQLYIIVLNVVSAATDVVPNPQPAGLLFIASSVTPASQTVQVYAGTSATQSYQASSDSSWLTVTPSAGATSSTAPASSSISVNLKALKAGVYTGGVSYSFSGAAVRTVNVTLIVEQSAVQGSDRPAEAPKAAPVCVAANLVATETGMANSFSQPAAWPTPLSVLLVDDCGSPVTNGQVVATFSNGDPPLLLAAADTTTGAYAGTWTPHSSGQQIAIRLTATAPKLAPVVTEIQGQVTPNVAPLLTPNGTLNAFAIAAEPGVPFAPGTIVAMYGSNLAAQAAQAGSIPLPSTLANTSVIIGGQQAPLYYVSPGQINAQVPFELAAGTPYQIIVNANGALSAPYPIQLVSDAPGIAQFASGQIIAQHQDYSLVTEASPAAPGEYIQMYLAGMGLTSRTVASGTASPSDILANALDKPLLNLNGTPVTNVVFAGLTPTLVGLYQVNFQVPVGVPDGDLVLELTQPNGGSNSSILPVHN